MVYAQLYHSHNGENREILGTDGRITLDARLSVANLFAAARSAIEKRNAHGLFTRISAFQLMEGSNYANAKPFSSVLSVD